MIDQIGRIYLRVNRNLDGAIKFFEEIIRSEDRLTEAEKTDIGAWLAAAKDLKRNTVKKGTAFNGIGYAVQK